MNVNAILAGLQQFSPDRIMTAAGFLLVLLVALAMWLPPPDAGRQGATSASRRSPPAFPKATAP